MRCLHRDQGVSVIIGTLLLILITVTAAAALGLMISQMQKAEMNRQTQIQAVKDEQIAISGVSLSNNQDLWNSTPYPHNISGSHNWSMISFNLMNLNTQNASVIGISVSSSPSNVNYLYPLNFSSLSGASPGYCNLTSGGGGCWDVNGNLLSPAYLTIPAGNSIKVTMNLTGSLTGDGYTNQFIGTDQQIDIKVLTSMTNIFEQTYRLPTPAIVYSTATTNLGNNIQQDGIVLDGSQSSAYNATIVGWNWTLTSATNTWPAAGTCSDIENLTAVSGFPTNGKIVHFSPPSDGPFCANLTVTDSNGMVATSPYQLIPLDPGFTPATDLIAIFNSSFTPPVINVTIRDINGNPVSNAAVNYILDMNQFGNLTLSNYVGTTNSIGMSSANVTCGTGTIKVVSGQLQPITVAVNANSGC
jgi:flagellin-like protein